IHQRLLHPQRRVDYLPHRRRDRLELRTMEANRATGSELTERGSGNRDFRIGDQCYLMPSTRFPKFSFLPCVIVGELASYDVYDDMGELIGTRVGYKVSAAGQEVCAPPGMLR